MKHNKDLNTNIFIEDIDKLKAYIEPFKFNPNVGVSSVQTGTYYPFANAIKFGSVINRSTQISFMYI